MLKEMQADSPTIPNRTNDSSIILSLSLVHMSVLSANFHINQLVAFHCLHGHLLYKINLSSISHVIFFLSKLGI